MPATCAVARGSNSGFSTPSAATSSFMAAMKRAVRISIGSRFSCARLMILSSISVMLRTEVTAKFDARSQRRTTSNTSITRACPR